MVSFRFAPQEFLVWDDIRALCMANLRVQRTPVVIHLRLLLAMAAWVACVATSVLMLYRLSYKPTWFAFLLSIPGAVFLCACVGTALATKELVGEYRKIHKDDHRNAVRVALILLLVLTCAGMVGEVGLRWASVQKPWGEELGTTLLLPRGWDRVTQRYNRVLDSFDATPNYFVEDSLLGWTVGSNRSSRDGLWHSSQEGLRSPTRGVTYLKHKGACRVALLGDSFTFGWQGTFEETWGSYLQERLGSSCQVLNFAVPGYSLGQMYLRYERDVTSWQPGLVVMSFTDGAPERGMGIYCFLMMANWETCPWAAPRFVVKNGQLELLNVPLRSPREIYRHKSIYDLPFIGYDRWYFPWQWEQPGWNLFYYSYLFRFVTSRYPLHSVPRPEVSDETMRQVSEAILRAFIEATIKNGTPFLVLYLPGKDDYKTPRQEPYSHGLLRNLDIDFVDATPCLSAVEAVQRFRAVGTHYAPAGEQAIADCVLPMARRALSSAHPAEGNREVSTLSEPHK
jgi:hypothetical protein